MQFVGGAAELNPNALDRLNVDKAVQVHAQALAIDPEISNSDEVVQQLRQAREQQRAQQQMLASAPGLAKAGKDLAATPTDNPDTALASVAPGLGG